MTIEIRTIQVIVTPVERAAVLESAREAELSVSSYVRSRLGLESHGTRPRSATTDRDIAKAIVYLAVNYLSHKPLPGRPRAITLSGRVLQVSAKWLRARWYEASQQPVPSARVLAACLQSICTGHITTVEPYTGHGRPTPYAHVDNAKLAALL